ncbi:YceI family protein [Maribellus comscasis]|uniref:YceI family protein n=1 Tax=Maribellus comscasis TaxID=2681766 RepID=A0A6I6JHI7_9BACT|nr:YceI family protein [Maribellus comscasis]QGY42256.1 YceI family protein [Maribellus comscasis]
MKKLSLVLLSVLFLSVGVMAKGVDDGKAVYKVDPIKSKVIWTGKKVTGEHTGTVLVDNGEVHVSGESLELANIKMDMNSIACTDLSGDMNQKLVGHLKSDDFFSVENHPQAVFEATGFKAGAADGEYIVTGKLTIKGITHELSFPATVEVNDGTVTANGTAEIDRTKYDVKYGSGKFFSGLGDKMIYDDFEIEFNLVATAEAI